MTIVKRGSGFRVVSEKGKNLGDEPSKAAAVKRLKQVEWFKHHAKCIVDPSLVKSGSEAYAGSDGNITIYQPIQFRSTKPKDKEGEKLDFPSTTKQLELKDVKQPQFPSTPFTGEAYADAFHNPRPSNSVKDGTHVIVQGDTPAAQGAGPFRGEHGPDVQFKGSDYVPDAVKKKARAANARKSIMIAGRKVIIKSTQGSDNENLRNYPIDRPAGEPIDPRNESVKRKDWIRSERVKEDVKAHEEAKKNYAPGNGPFELAMDAKTAYLGRAKESKPVGEYTKEYPGAKVTFNQPIDPAKKPKKVFVHLTEQGRDVKAKRTDKSKGIMRLILQYTQNQPLAAGFKPLLAHLVQEEDDRDEPEPKKTIKTMTSADIYDRIASTRNKEKPLSPKLSRLSSRAAKVAEDSGGTAAHDEAAPIHPGVDYKQLQPKSDRPNPFKGGKGDDLDYDDVDQAELESGIKTEQEHIGDDPDMDEDEKRVKGADIAMDHLAEDEHYYTKLKEMERTSKEGAKAETKKEKLLKLGEVGKSVIKERKLTQTVANAEKMKEIREQTGASSGEMKATHGQLRAYTAKLKAERKKNEGIRKGKYSEDPERAGHKIGQIAYAGDVHNKYQSDKKEAQVKRINEKMDKKHGDKPEYQRAIKDITDEI